LCSSCPRVKTMNDSIRVLVVDNEPSFCAELCAYLDSKGFQTETATSGPEAVEQVQACRGELDVAVIDQVMGPPNGTEIMLEIHRLYPAIEVLILTAWGNMEPGEKAMDLGAYRYMSKPVAPEELAFNIRIAARLGREQQRRLALEALVRAGHRIGAARTEDRLYEMLHEEALKLLPGLSAFLISSFDEQTGVVSFPYACRGAARLEMPARQDGNSITEFVLKSGRPLLLPFGDDAFRQQNGINPPHSGLGHCTSEIASPMFVAGRVVGAISALSFEPNVRYTQEHQQVLQAFANQAAVAIQNIQQLEEAKQLRDAAAALACRRGIDALIRAIVEEAHKLIASDLTALVLQDEDGTLHTVQPVLPEEQAHKFEEPRQQGGLTRAVVESGQPKVIPDTRLDPMVKESVRQGGIRSMLVFPLIYGGRVLGVLYAHILSSRYFSSHDVDLWATFATQAAAALYSTIEEDREIRGARQLADALGTLTEKLDLRATMLRVATAAKAVFEADTCRLAYVDPPTGRVLDWLWADGDAEEYRFQAEPRPGGITDTVLGTKQPVFRSTDGPQTEPWPHPALLSRGLRFSASLPLLVGERVIAVLHCSYFTRQPPFNERLKALVEAFSARAAMALDRARRDQKSKIWNDLDRRVATCMDLRTLYRLFADHARRAFSADFAVFYPYDPTALAQESVPLSQQYIHVGELRSLWQTPEGGCGGGVHDAIKRSADGLLIINRLEQPRGRFGSCLAEREGIKAFIGLKLEPAGQTERRLAGMLFLNFREYTAFERSDVIQLRYAGSLIAAGILRLNLREDMQKLLEQRNLQLRAVLDILQAFEREGAGISLDFVARRVARVLSIDACTILEYSRARERFTRRGTGGLRYPDAHYTLPLEFETRYLQMGQATEIADVQLDELMKDSGFVRREGIRSTNVFPLHVEGEAVGLLFASYREPQVFSAAEKEAVSLFADLAALLLHQARLGDELGQTKQRLARRLILDWVSMIEASWRHSLVQKASAIRNYAAILRKRLEQKATLPPAMEGIPAVVAEIDRLAAEIAAAPPRVPQSWEMEGEILPLASLLEEVAEREGKPSLLRAGPPVEIRTDVESLGGAQVRGYRRWLIYALEALLQNARSAMPQGGRVIISGSRVGPWAEVRIQDTGSGVPEAIRHHLFRELIAKEQDVAGMGIGSLLAATIVEEHGGRIELEKPGPNDTTVLICMPVAAEAEK
jgi:two-component system response regulator (stage 0 sporulation protein F)